MSNIVEPNQNHLGRAHVDKRENYTRRYAAVVDTLYVLTGEYETGARRLAGRLCEECEPWNCDPQGRMSGKQKHTTVMAYICIGVLSTPTELIFIRH